MSLEVRPWGTSNQNSSWWFNPQIFPDVSDYKDDTVFTLELSKLKQIERKTENMFVYKVWSH